MGTYYVVEYIGRFAFIKPFFANSHELIYSQQFLTLTIIVGIENMLFPNNKKGCKSENKFIERHKLRCTNFSKQQEEVRSPNHKRKSIIKKGYMVNPTLYLAFNCKEAAEFASTQSISLTQNECLVYPTSNSPYQMTEKEFDELKGGELLFDDGQHEDSILVGTNRLKGGEKMYGVFVGEPIV